MLAVTRTKIHGGNRDSWNLTHRDHRSDSERGQPSESQKGQRVERLPHPPTLPDRRNCVTWLATYIISLAMPGIRGLPATQPRGPCCEGLHVCANPAPIGARRVAVLATGASGACSDTEDTPSLPAVAPVEEPAPEPEPEPEPALEPVSEPALDRAMGSRANPVPLRIAATFAFGEDDHWEVAVLATQPDATAAVLAENPFNDPPGEGTQFYLVTLRATYRGTASAQFNGSFRLRTLGESGVVYTTFEHSCGVIPNTLPNSELFAGGTVEGNECWAIASQ